MHELLFNPADPLQLPHFGYFSDQQERLMSVRCETVRAATGTELVASLISNTAGWWAAVFAATAGLIGWLIDSNLPLTASTGVMPSEFTDPS